MKKFAALVLVLFVGSAFADDKKEEKKDAKIDAAKLVGTWELVKGSDDVPKGMVIEFTKDGKLTAKFEIEGKKIEMVGTYTLDGAKLKYKVKAEGMEHEDEDTITTLTDEKIVMVDKDKKESEWKKKK
jgi:uncharacterized protein (TIGR03066 family)